MDTPENSKLIQFTLLMLRMDAALTVNHHVQLSCNKGNGILALI